MKTILENVRLVSPGIDQENSAIVMENGIITGVGKAGSFSGGEKTDCSGLTAMPGFIDIHCHGFGGSDFCDATDEALQVIAHGKPAEGVTGMLATTLTLPVSELEEILRTVRNYEGGGCRFFGIHLEGPFVNKNCAGAQNVQYAGDPDAEVVRKLDAICKVRKISFAPELPGSEQFVVEMLKLGVVPSAVHTAAKYTDFKRVRACGLENMSHFCNQMTPLHHRDIGMVGAGLLDDSVYLEFICDKLHVSPEMIALVFKVRGTGKIQLITDAMRAAGMPDGEYTLGGLPVTVSGGAARLTSNGALAGSTLRLNHALRNVYEITGLPLSQLVACTSWNQAQALHLAKCGKLEAGNMADVVLLDEDFEVVRTFVGGTIVYERK